MRKLTIIFLFLMVNVWFALGWTPPSPITPPDTIPDAVANMNLGIVGGNVPLSCTQWKSMEEASPNDQWGSSPDTMGQKIKNTSGSQIEICQIDPWLKRNGGTNATIKVCTSGDCTTGCSDSSDVAAVAAAPGDYVAMTWTGANPTVAGLTDFWICVNQGDGGVSWSADTDSTKYEDTDYDSWRGNADINGDFNFKLYIKQ